MDGDQRRTRRDVIRSGVGLAAVGTVAGCMGSDEGPSDGAGTDGAGTDDGDASGTENSSDGSGEATATETERDESDTVSIEPVGSVAFDSPPERWLAGNGSWADMGVALGMEPPEGVWLTRRYHTRYYDEIPGISVDGDAMTDLYQDGVDKERFYAAEADVHVMDPNFVTNRFKGWTDSDIEEIESTVGPFFGNAIFSRGYPWHEDYRYYSLYEAFEKLADVFRRRERYEAFASLHEEFQSRVEDVVPTSEERPSVAILWPHPLQEPTKFSPYLIDEGTSYKQWRDLGVEDALATTDVADFHETRGRIDYETLLKVDPDVLLLRGSESLSADEFADSTVSFVENHNVASELTAVENGDVYRGGPLYQGPIFNLHLTERAARQLYDVDDQLYDRDRVADIVDGRV